MTLVLYLYGMLHEWKNKQNNLLFDTVLSLYCTVLH